MTALRSLAFAVVWILHVNLSTSTRIDGVCTPFTTDPNGKARPIVPDVFRVNVECAMLEQNRTVYVREYFDYNNNVGRVMQQDLLTKGDAIFDYNADEILLIDTENNLCLVGVLSTSDNRWMFGYKDSDHGEPHVFGASGALHFGDSPEKYIGVATVRGILAEQFDSCQYSEALNATMSVTWYFSSKTEWDMQLGAKSVPLRAIATGKQYKAGTVVPFHHVYDFYKFEPYVYPEDFEIPVGVLCPGRIKTQPFPTMPNQFSFNGEIVDAGQNIFLALEENYDHLAKINVFRYKHKEDVESLTGGNGVIQINDFNEGVTFLVDQKQGSCQVAEIGQGSGYSFVKYLDNGMVRMKTPAEFFIDGSVVYTYAGVRSTRGILCNVWVGTTNTIQGYTGTNLTVEWYFSTSEGLESWNEAAHTPMPVLFRLFMPGEVSSFSYDFNIFYYNTKFYLPEVDVSQCFTGSERKTIRFSLPKSSESVVRQNLLESTSSVMNSISLFTGISALRVDNVQFYFNPGNVDVTFDLLDRPPHYSDINGSLTQNSLSAAYGLLTDAFSSKIIKFSVVNSTFGITEVSPVYGSLADITTSYGTADGQSGSDLYGVGALAGLGVGMLIIGGAGGAGGAYAFFK